MNEWNVMLLVGEDTGRHHGCYGDFSATTPAIDGLAAEGRVYDQAFSTAPVCAPSRSTIASGKYAFSIGSHHMRSTLIDPPALFTGEILKAGGYVNWANKTDFNFSPPEDFADETSEWFDDLAGRRLPNRPWFLYHNFQITHESSLWEETWSEKVLPFIGEDRCCDPDQVRVPAYLPDTPEVRGDIARYYDCLQMQDMQVARALDALERSGEQDRTVVVYMSDHGRGLLREKRWCYDAGIHLPLIIRWPGVLGKGERSSQLVSWVDVAPTILSIMGVPIPPDYQGRAFLGDAAREPRESCFAGRDRMDEAFDRIRVVRDGRFHYIRNFFPQLPYAQRIRYMERMETTRVARKLYAEGKLDDAQSVWFRETKPQEELYDSTADPDNVNNLAELPEYADVLARMRREMDAFLDDTGDLAAQPERVLIDRGLVEDRLQEYNGRIEPLPERYRIGVAKTVLEMPKE